MKTLDIKKYPVLSEIVEADAGSNMYGQAMKQFDALLDTLEKLDPKELSKTKMHDISYYTHQYLLPLLKKKGII